MRSIMMFFIVAAASISQAIAGGAHGFEQHPQYQANKSAAAQKLFVEMCSRFTVAPASWREFVAARKLRRAHAMLETRLLHGQAGESYLIPSKTLGFFTVSVFASGVCTVTTWRAKPEDFARDFYDTVPFYNASFGKASVAGNAGTINVALPDGRAMTATMRFVADSASTAEVTYTMQVTRPGRAKPPVLTAKARPAVPVPDAPRPDTLPAKEKPRQPLPPQTLIFASAAGALDGAVALRR